MTDTGQLLARLARVVATEPALRPLTWRLCVGCQEIVGADSASITVDGTSPNRVTVCTTDDLAMRIEDLQDVTGEGPSLEAFDTGLPVVATLDASAGKRWPLFVPAARQAVGDLTVYAIPMRPSAATLGVVSLLRRPPGELRESLEATQFLADAIGAALLTDPLSTADFGMAGTWSERAGIHQATGMVVAQLAIGADDALALLKAHAYSQAISLSEVAAMVLMRELDFRVST